MQPFKNTTAGVVASELGTIAPDRLGRMLKSTRVRGREGRRGVARSVGTTASELRRFERGTADVPIDLLSALLDHYRVNLGAPTDFEDRDDRVLYAALLARPAPARPGRRIVLRADDLAVLASALGLDSGLLEARIAQRLGRTPREARARRSELSRRKAVILIAGLVTTLAVAAGAGVADLMKAATGGAAPSRHVVRPASTSSPAPTVATTLPPSTSTTATSEPVVPSTAPIAAAPTDPPITATTVTAIGSALSLVAPATTTTTPPTTDPPTTTTTVKPPHVTRDTTPMTIPPGEGGVIIH
jgi:hypothetical protein